MLDKIDWLEKVSTDDRRDFRSYLKGLFTDLPRPNARQKIWQTIIEVIFIPILETAEDNYYYIPNPFDLEDKLRPFHVSYSRHNISSDMNDYFRRMKAGDRSIGPEEYIGPFLRTAEAATMVGCSETKLRRLARQGIIRAQQNGRKHWRFSCESLKYHLRKGTLP